MRFGVSGEIIPANLDDLNDAVIREVKKLGFTGIFSRFRDDPFETTTAQCRRVHDLLEANGLTMYQATGFWQCLIHPDESERRRASRTLGEALRVAADLGARGVDTGPGSLSPRGPWSPHPYNWTRQARDQLVKSLRECARAAEDCGVYLSLEGHQLVTARDAATTRDILDEVGSPMVRSDFDPVNWITLETIFKTDLAIEQMLDTLGPRVVSAHAKDVVLEDRHVVHLSVRPAGRGQLDYRAFLRRVEALDPSYPVIVEGATANELPFVKRFLDSIAGELGIRVW